MYKRQVQIATQLIRFGEVKSLWIGNFRVSRVDLKINDKYSSGLRIVEMEKIGPLFDRGIQINDIITKINDQDSNWNNLIQSLRYATLGESLKLEFYTVSNEFKTYEFKYSGD